MIILERMWQKQEVHWLEISDFEHGLVVECCDYCNGTGASTKQGIYLTEVFFNYVMRIYNLLLEGSNK
jgi:hypothetical protein